MEKEEDKGNQRNCSYGPEEDLRIENEILKLKMQAERGAWFVESSGDLPPEIEAQFLKNVELFESNFENAKEMSVYECIGSPSYKKAEELDPAEAEVEMIKLLELMQAKNINLDMLGEYEPVVIYKFITEELFNEKITEMNIPGYTQNFMYEEFHPNHKMDIGNTAQRFLNDWFEKGFNEYSSELAAQMVTAEGKIFSKEEVLQKLYNCLDCYRKFVNIKFAGGDISFEWNEKESKGLGHAEGMFKYEAENENGEIVHVEGPYKLYMINEYGLWQIFYFVFPGFSW